jgi:hypothetical protein
MSRIAYLITHSVRGVSLRGLLSIRLFNRHASYAMNMTHPLLEGWMAACTSEETHPRPQKPSPYTVIDAAYNCLGEFRSG